jgi:hypothetical protein
MDPDADPEGQNLMDPTDLEADPDPQHWCRSFPVLSKYILLFRLPEDFVCTAYTCAVSNRNWSQSCDVEADPAVSNNWKPGAHCEAIWPANGRWHPAKEWRVHLKAYVGCF